MIIEGVHDKYDGKAIFVIGPPASGKTTIIKKIVDTFHFNISDSDTHFERLMSKYNLPLKMDTLSGAEVEKKDELHHKAYETNKERTYLWIKNRRPIIISRTGRIASDILDYKRNIEKEGYDCLLILIDIEEDVALKRNEQRVRSVNRDYVKTANKEFKKNTILIKSWFKHVIYIDNTKMSEEDLSQYEKQVRQWLNNK